MKLIFPLLLLVMSIASTLMSNSFDSLSLLSVKYQIMSCVFFVGYILATQKYFTDKN